MELLAQQIVRLHDHALALWQGEPDAATGVLPVMPGSAGHAVELADLLEAAHFANYTIWRLEDEARRRDADDALIAATKRAIDPWNQRRNDLMEKIDSTLLEPLANIDVGSAELHSETAGMIIDRLSVLALKIRNMRIVGEDAAAEGDTELAEECVAKSVILEAQREDLAECLAKLFADFAAGRRYFKSYQQMKTYNDERLNPVLRRAARRKAV